MKKEIILLLLFSPNFQTDNLFYINLSIKCFFFDSQDTIPDKEALISILKNFT